MANTLSMYEKEQAAIAERAARKANIEELRQKIEDAEMTVQVMPRRNHSDPDLMREHRTMRNHINHLREMLQDEVNRYNATYQASQEDVAIVISKLK